MLEGLLMEKSRYIFFQIFQYTNNLRNINHELSQKRTFSYFKAKHVKVRVSGISKRTTGLISTGLNPLVFNLFEFRIVFD